MEILLIHASLINENGIKIADGFFEGLVFMFSLSFCVRVLVCVGSLY